MKRLPYRKFRDFAIQNIPTGYLLIRVISDSDLLVNRCIIEECNKKAIEYLGIEELDQSSLTFTCSEPKYLTKETEAILYICQKALSNEMHFELCLSNGVFDVYISLFDEFMTVILSDITLLYNLKEELDRKNKELAIINANLYNKTIKDGLTKLYSREFLIEVIEKSIQKVKRCDSSFTVCIIDVDNFKYVNDAYGHLIGDEVLRSLSEILSKNLRVSDFLGRYGGEEFILLLQETGVQETFEICERMRRQIELKKFRVKDEVFSVTISIGIAKYKNQSLEDLISVADQKMYEAKRHGKNRIVY